MTARWNGKEKKGSAPRVEHTGHCSKISTKTTLSNHIKINGFEIEILRMRHFIGYNIQSSSKINPKIEKSVDLLVYI